MKLLLGMLMVLMVSGDDVKTIDGFLKTDVRLSCTCLDRNLAKDFKWQTKKNNSDQLVYVRYGSDNTTKFGESYRGRVQTFLDKNISDCSILIRNVTAEDQGQYECIFNRGGLHNYSLMNLTVFSRFSVHQYFKYLSSNETLFHCDVKGGDNNTEITWKADGKVLENSSMVAISTTHIQLHAPTGLYNHKSQLKTKLTWTSGPECGTSNNEQGPPRSIVSDPVFRTHSYSVFPLLLVVGVLLVLRYRQT